MCNPTAHVVEADLRGFARALAAVVDATPAAIAGGLVKCNRTELRQWCRRDVKAGLPKAERLTPVDWAVIAVIAPWRGLRGGEDGCGVQLSARAMARLVGAHRRYVSKSFARLVKLGLLRRRPRAVAVRWKGTKKGKAHHYEHADIHSVCYLTKAGAARLEAVQGRTRRLVVSIGAGAARILTATGLVGKVLVAIRQKISLVARRVSSLGKKDRPTAVKLKRKETKTSGPQGHADFEVRGSNFRPRTPRKRGGDAKGAGMGGDELNLRALWSRGELTPDRAWPDWWRQLGRLTSYVNPEGQHRLGGHTPSHWWGIRECERLGRKFQAELSDKLEPGAGARHTSRDRAAPARGPRARPGLARARAHGLVD